MAKSSLVSNIIMFSQSKENDALLINIISRNFAKVLVVDKINSVSEALRDLAPKVIFVSCETLQESLATYYQALDEVQGGKICEHCVVGVISRHDEKDAYEAYCSGIIDDYLVARPLYELHRPVVICQHLLKKVGLTEGTTHKTDFLQYKKNYNDAAKEIIAKGIERKESMKKDFENSLSQIDKALDAAADRIQKHQTVKLDMEMLKKTLSAIKSDEIRPELLKIQNKAIQLLEQVVSDAQSSFSAENMLFSDETELPDIEIKRAASAAAEKSVTKVAPALDRTHAEAPIATKPVVKEKIPKVLIIEDDEISLHLTQVLLGNYKLEFDSAETGRRAFACLSSREYDLVLMDINLPDTNGLYILDQIRTTANLNKKTPIIMLTGNKNKNTVRQAIEAGAKGYIIKPLHQTSVVKLFEKYHLPLLEKA
ncbi:PleD family two-component system response regulator [Shewanella sp. SR44-3]|uniref:response regulator n=1 Tax=unclassified Shewanella TaxID=196818 RepID=UPI0015FBF002|nr:response regulator [Shewanella sp. SR44-3]MBB1269407.1 response regulator [Shewanella sp. SR44-3]